MTDEQIIKAKKIIKDLHAYCFVSQPSYREMGYKFCESDFNCLNDLIDELNRQKAEIEKNENIIRLADKTVEKQSAEIERVQLEIESCNSENAELRHKIANCYLENVELKAEIDRLLHSLDETNKYIPKIKERAKTEAIKEFAERLKEKFGVPYEYGVGYVIGSIDNLVKEMMEGKE